MAARKRRRTTRKRSGLGAGFLLLACAALLATGTAAGYLLRSYAPLPLPGALSEAREPAAIAIDGRYEEMARAAEAKKRAAEQELAALRERLREVERSQEEAEEDLADLQIRSILESN